MSRPVKLLVVDDHPVVRDGIRLLVETQQDMKVVAEAGTGEAALEAYAEHRPDVVIMDLRLPGMSGSEAAAALRRDHPAARIIILTSYGGDADIRAALGAGARGYVRKDADRNELLVAFRTVHAGGRYLSSDVRERLAETLLQSELTKRELDVLQGIARGMTNKEIGVSLSISEDTVKLHPKNLFSMLDVDDRTLTGAVAVRRGIIKLE